MTKRILIVISEWGYWGEELIGPLDVLTEAGYQLDFMTPFGRKPVALPPSMDEGFIDVPLKKCVTDSYYAARTKEVDESELLSSPLNLSDKLPLMPYFNSENFGLELEKFYNLRDQFWNEYVDPYDALVLPGGSGPMADMVNNERLHNLILGYVDRNKLIAFLVWDLIPHSP